MRHLLFALMILLFASTLYATPYVYEGVVENTSVGNYSGECQILSEKESPLVEKVCLGKVKVKYKIYPNLGEPTEAYYVHWTIEPHLYLRPGNHQISKRISSMPKKVQEAFKNLRPVSPTEFLIKSFFGTSVAYFIFDGGSLTRSGEGYSYNTPGSPDWDDFIFTGIFVPGLLNMDTLDPLPEPKAKAAFQQLNKEGFSYAGIRHLTFFGVSELNDAIEGAKTYPLVINIIDEETSIHILDAKIKILNIKPRYIWGIRLKKGVYPIQVSKEGYKTVTTSVRLGEENTDFPITLKKKSAKEDELEELFDEIEESEANGSLEGILEAIESDSMATAPQGRKAIVPSLDSKTVNQQSQQQNNIQKIQKYGLEKRLVPLKIQYENDLQSCDKNKPTKPALKFECNYRSMLYLLGPSMTDWSAARKKRYWDEVDKDRAEDTKRVCSARNKEWNENVKSYPGKLAKWQASLNICQKRVLHEYNQKIESLIEEAEEINSMIGELELN